MASNLPIDFSHPSVKEYVALIRLQVLTPLSTLVHIATILAIQFVISPSLGEIIAIHNKTAITPNPVLVAAFFLVLWALQIGYCFLLVIAWSDDTKKALVHGTGMTFVFVNWLMAGYSVAMSMQSFIPATVLIAITVLFLIFINLRLAIYYPAYWTDPFDYILLHAPARLFLLLTLILLLPMTVFMAIGHHWELPNHDMDYPWEGFAAVMSAGVLATIIAGWRRDLVWSAGTVWLFWSIGSLKNKSTPVMIGIIVFSIVIPLTFMASLILAILHSRRREGRVRLDGDDPIGAPPPHRATPEGRGNHEVSEDVWG